ncbi:MAG: RHS repeat-associated core domain-containing protein [Edaphobacter sp.]
MHPATEQYIPDGLLAANALLAENSRQGSRTSTHTMYQGFGVVISSTSLGINESLYDGDVRSRYTGKERDAETGLDYFGARYYGSSMGRFMSPDDGSDQDITNPQSFNLYSYVQNNPLTNTDPDGQTCQTNSTDGNTYDDMDGKGCATVDQQDADRLKNGQYDATVNGGGSSSLGTLASNAGGLISNAASSTMNFVSQAGSQLSNIAQTPGGIGCMASLAGSGGMAGAATGGGVGLVGLAGGGVGVLVTEPAGLAIGGVGGAASGVALGMTVCPGGALAMSNSGRGFGGNQRENKQANDAKQEAERDTGKKFDRALDRKFHDEITGQGYGYHELVEIAKQVLQGHI